VTYHHIELARHDVVLAEGLPAETYLDSGNRGNFAEGAGAVALHADFAAKSRAAACAELLVDGAIVEATRGWLLGRAYALGFAATDAMDLTVSVGGQVLALEPGVEAGEILVILPPGATAVALASSTGVPAEVSANPGDRRELGAAITGIALIANGARTEIALDGAALTGFHDMEAGHRWTTGHASIALPEYSGRAVLEIITNGQATRWAAIETRAIG
jgi:hypothetical protein